MAEAIRCIECGRPIINMDKEICFGCFEEFLEASGVMDVINTVADDGDTMDDFPTEYEC